MKYLLICIILISSVLAFDKLVNPKATTEAQQLHQKLIDNYGKYSFSGQTTFHYDDFVNQMH